MKKTAIFLVAAVCLVSYSALGRNGDAQIMPTVLIKSEIWAQVRGQTVTNQNPRENDMSELLARLVMVERGEELSDEAMRRTIERASNPKGGYGLWDNGGIKRMFALFVLSSYERNAKIRLLCEENARQQQAIEQLKAEIAELRSRMERTNGK